MVKVKLFQQKPKVEKFKPLPITRAVDSIDLDRKEELEKFRRWLEGTAKRKSKLPKKRELDKLNKEVKSGRANKFGLLGILGALPLVGPLLGFGGALASLSVGAISAIGGGLLTAGGLAIGGGLKLFGVVGAGIVGGTRLLGKAGQKLFGGGKKGPANNIRTGPRGGGGPRGGASPGVKPQTSATPNRPASSPSRSNAAGNQVSGRGQQYRNNLNRSQQPAPTTQPRRPSFRAKLGSQMETGTAFGGKGSAAQKKLFKLQQRLSKLFKGKNPLGGFLSKIFKSSVGRKAFGKILLPFFKRIPVLGSVIGTLIDILIFKVDPGRAAFRNAVGLLAGVISGGLVGVLSGPLGFVTGPVAGTVGQIFGSWFGDWLFSQIFGGPQPDMGKVKSDVSENELFNDLLGEDEQDDEEPPAPELPGGGEPPAQPLRGQVTSSGNGPLVDVISDRALKVPYGVPSGPVRTRGRSGSHGGVDIGTGSQTGYYVAYRRSGRVSLVQYLSGYGNTVIIQIGNLDFLFAHLARKSNLVPGQAYNGEIIGEIGNTGRSFGGGGQHLHFEVRPAGGGGQSDIDPEPYVSALVIGRLDPNSEQSRVGGVQSGAETLNAAGQIRSAEAQEQERPKSFIEQLTDMLPESAKGAVSSVIESFKIFGYMADRELMDSLVINPDGTVSRKIPEPVDKPFGDSFVQGMNTDIMDSIGIPQADLSVEMLSPEAEAALNNSIIMMMGQPPVQSMGGEGDSPVAVAPQQPQQPVLVLGGHQDALAAVKLLQAHALS